MSTDLSISLQQEAEIRTHDKQRFRQLTSRATNTQPTPLTRGLTVWSLFAAAYFSLRCSADDLPPGTVSKTRVYDVMSWAYGVLNWARVSMCECVGFRSVDARQKRKETRLRQRTNTWNVQEKVPTINDCLLVRLRCRTENWRREVPLAITPNNPVDEPLQSSAQT